MNEYHISITNLTCMACNKVCSMVLKKIDGVESVEIKADGATTIAANKPLDMESVIKTLAEKGFNAVINK